MSYFKQAIKSAIESGDLIANGDLIFKGEMIHDHIEPEPTKNDLPTDLGFYGHPDKLGCRPNIYAERVIKQFANSDSKYDRMAAANAPRSFMFWDKVTDPIINNTDLEPIYRKNHNAHFLMRMVCQLVDDKGHPIDGKYFLSFGNANFMGETRDSMENKIIDSIAKFIEFNLRNQSSIYRFGSLADRY